MRPPHIPGTRLAIPHLDAGCGPAQDDEGEHEGDDDCAGAHQPREVVAAGERGGDVVAGLNEVCGSRTGEGREHRETERAAHLTRRIEDARGQPGVIRPGVGHGDDRQRGEGQAATEAEQCQGHHQLKGIAGIRGPEAEHCQRDHGDDLTGHHHGERTEAVDQLSREANREDSHHERDWKEGEPDRHRAVVEHALEVERSEEEETQEGGRHERLHDVRRGEVARREHAQRENRVATARLARDERGEQGEG